MPLSQREKDICARLRSIRKGLHISRTRFALLLGIGSERLASYESARVPLPYEVAKRFCFHFNINQRWLARGLPPPKPYFDVSPHLEYGIPPRALLSEAYDKRFHDQFEERLLRLKELIGKELLESGEFEDAILDTLHHVGAPLREGLTFYLSEISKLHLGRMPPELQAEYFETMTKTATKFYAKHKKAIEAWVQERERAKKTGSSVPPTAF